MGVTLDAGVAMVMPCCLPWWIECQCDIVQTGKVLDVYVNVNLTSAAMSEAAARTTYSIGDLSREFQVTTRTIRFYEDEGLLRPRRQGQSRIYMPRDRVRLKLILRGKRLGFSIREIKDMLDMYDAPEGEVGQLRYFMDRMRERRADLLRQRADIDQVLGELGALEARCEDILVAQAPAARRASR